MSWQGSADQLALVPWMPENWLHPLMGRERAVQESLFLPLVGCGTQVSRPLPLLSKAGELALVARALER